MPPFEAQPQRVKKELNGKSETFRTSGGRTAKNVKYLIEKIKSFRTSDGTAAENVKYLIGKIKSFRISGGTAVIRISVSKFSRIKTANRISGSKSSQN